MKCKLFFLLFLSFNIIISISLNSKDSKALERISNTIKLILSLDIKIRITKFLIEYPKYILYGRRLSGLIILNPNEILVTQDENNKSKFTAHNITTEQILFCKLNYINTYDLLEYDFVIEIHYSKIIFLLINDYLILEYMIIDSYKVEPVNGMANLDYFKLLNEGTKGKYKDYDDEIFEINNLHKTLAEKSKKFFSLKIKEIRKIFNLLTYDLYNILNSSISVNISCSEDIIKNYNVTYIYFSNIKTNLNNLHFKSPSSLWVDKIEFIGYYKSNLFENITDFSFILDYESNCVLSPYSFNLTIDRDKIKGDIFKNHPEQIDAIYNAIKNDFISIYLKNVVNKYYNSFSN